MKITIDDNRKISEIQEEFNREFPFLKIEFSSIVKRSNISAIHRITEKINAKIQDCRTIHTNGEIMIDPLMSVTELEKLFKDNFGLSVRLFRKSVNVWLDTSVTDDWSLNEQNEQGEALSKITA